MLSLTGILSNHSRLSAIDALVVAHFEVFHSHAQHHSRREMDRDAQQRCGTQGVGQSHTYLRYAERRPTGKRALEGSTETSFIHLLPIAFQSALSILLIRFRRCSSYSVANGWLGGSTLPSG